MISRRIAQWFDARLGAASFARSVLRKVFPDHFSFMFGEIALYAFVVLVLTGVFLTFFFDPGLSLVVYEGSYEPLRGARTSDAYRSALELSFDVRAGLVMRQMHHWAALVFLAAIVIHLCRIFFTGAFRRPREINWMVGLTLLLLALANGFAGYSLLDDLLSGTGLRIAYSLVESVPVIGAWTAFLVFGGEFPSDDMISRLFVLHVLLLPAAIAGLLGVHLALIWRQTHTDFAFPRRTEHNLIGSRLWPTYTAKSLALFFAVAGSLALLGGVVQINPIWLYGPYEPSAVTTGAQPDWYVGWLEGALRLFPPWEVRIGDYMIPNPFFPGVLLPLLTFAGLYSWPFVESRLTGDRAPHHLLDRPRDRPVRTGFGVAVLTFYVVLFVAGSQDVIASELDVSVQAVMWIGRIAALALPPLAGLLAWRLARDLARGDEHEREVEETLRKTPELPAAASTPTALPAVPASRGRRWKTVWRWAVRGAALAVLALVAAVAFRALSS